MKRILPLFLSLLLFISFSTPAQAYTGMECTLDVPAQIQNGKAAYASIFLTGSDTLGAAVFSMTYDPGFIEIKDVTLSGSGGEVNHSINNGSLRIVYVNTGGVALSGEATSIISIKIKALQSTGDTALAMYTEQAAAIDESYMYAENGMEYTLAIQDKEVTSTASANGRSVENTAATSVNNSRRSSSSSKTSSSKSNHGEKATKDSSQKENLKNDELDTYMQLGSAASWLEENMSVFIWGASFAVGLSIILFVLYKAVYQKKKNSNSSTYAKEDASSAPLESTSTSQQKPKDDTASISSQDHPSLSENLQKENPQPSKPHKVTVKTSRKSLANKNTYTKKGK